MPDETPGDRARHAFQHWKPRFGKYCDKCKQSTDELFDIPVSAVSGTVQSVCLACAIEALDKPQT